ncbi:MAG: IS982 family transposase [Pyrinomonadaceae bacterium]
MDLDTLIISVFCQIDDHLQTIFSGKRLRQRGRAPLLSDAEVLTIETVGEFLGFSQDKQIYEYFRRHHQTLFPNLRRVHRTSFVRQAANLWRVKEQLWQAVLRDLKFDRQISLIDSFPVEVCRFARANRCRTLREISAFGYDEVARQTFFGVRFHLRVALPGIITAFEFAPANVHEIKVAEELFENVKGFALGDRNYWSPDFLARAREKGLQIIAPFRKAKYEKRKFPRSLTNLRRRIETVIGQLAGRFTIKRVWARDCWHFCSRLLRKVLAHTIFVGLCQKQGCEPLQMAQLLSN